MFYTIWCREYNSDGTKYADIQQTVTADGEAVFTLIDGNLDPKKHYSIAYKMEVDEDSLHFVVAMGG